MKPALNKGRKSKRRNSSKEVKIGSVVCHKYLLQKEIGKGTFGKIYLGLNQENNEQYAIKIENCGPDERTQTLLKEAKILYDLKGERGVPRMYYFIKDEKLSIMVMTLLHKNMEELYKENDRKFTLKSVLLAADHMLSRIEYLHSLGYIHRDIKPENFMVGLDKSQIYLIDFGLSKKYLDPSGVHIPYKEKIGFVGTARYTSVYSHLGIEQSRRDDLESLGYVLVFFLKGKLPWMNLEGATKEEKHCKIAETKMKTSLIDLCKGLPQQFLQYFEYIKELNFTKLPSYSYLRKLFRTYLMTNIAHNDLKFDWETENDSKNKENGSCSIKMTDVNKRKSKHNNGGRLKSPEDSNQLKVIFKKAQSKSMRTTKEEDEIALALLTNGNEKESFCTSSKSVRVSENKKEEEYKKSDDMGFEKKFMDKENPDIKIITPPSDQKELLIPSKSLKISKHDMFNKLSTVGFCNTVFRQIDGIFFLEMDLIILIKIGFSDEDIESTYMNEYLKSMKVKDKMKYLEKNKVIISQVNFFDWISKNFF